MNNMKATTLRQGYQKIRRPQWHDTLQFLYCPWMRNHRVAQLNHSIAEGATWP